jgi:hypothetical protein
MIRKPEGQASRLRRGGYSLLPVLQWDKELYKNVSVGSNLFILLLPLDGDAQAFVHDVADEHLVVGHPYSSQDASAIDLVCNKVRESLLPH